MHLNNWIVKEGISLPSILHGEFDPGSGRTLAVRFMHASRTRGQASACDLVADG